MNDLHAPSLFGFADVRRQHPHRSEPLLRDQALLHTRSHQVVQGQVAGHDAAARLRHWFVPVFLQAILVILNRRPCSIDASALGASCDVVDRAMLLLQLTRRTAT